MARLRWNSKYRFKDRVHGKVILGRSKVPGVICSPASLCGFHGLDLKCPPKSHIVNVWPPDCSTTMKWLEPLGGGAWWRELGHWSHALEGLLGPSASSFSSWPAGCQSEQIFAVCFHLNVWPLHRPKATGLSGHGLSKVKKHTVSLLSCLILSFFATMMEN